MKLYDIDFEGAFPVGNVLIIKAESQLEAFILAEQTIKHTKITIDDVREVELNSDPQVITYLDGNY